MRRDFETRQIEQGQALQEYMKLKSRKPDTAWKWRKWTFGFWTDPSNWTAFGIDIGPLEIVWRYEGYRQ
jgi:hypothetical protein